MSMTQREFELLQDLIRNGFAGVHDRLDKVNGRLDDHDKTLVVQHGEIEVLKDRSSNSTMALGTGIGAILIGAGKFLWDLYRGSN